MFKSIYLLFATLFKKAYNYIYNFISPKASTNKRCTSPAFKDKGFSVIFPEGLPLPDHEKDLLNAIISEASHAKYTYNTWDKHRERNRTNFAQWSKNLNLDNNGFPTRNNSPENKDAFGDSAELQAYQQNVTVYYDGREITPDQVHEIQLIKSGQAKRMDDKKFRELESLASFQIARGQVRQFRDMSQQDYKIDCGVERTLYYVNTPKLNPNPNTADVEYFCVTGTVTKKTRGDKDWKPTGVLRPDRLEQLSEKYEKIISLAVTIAGKNNEAFSMVTPNAFLAGLDKANKEKAQSIFLSAVWKVAIKYWIGKGCRGLFISAPLNLCKQYHNLFHAMKSAFRYPVILNITQDSHALPCAIKTLNNLDFRVAEAVMGEPMGKVGNGWKGRHAAKAFEENLCRQAPMTVSVFSGYYNRKLNNKQEYVKIMR